jgi:hypothetical protein
MGEARGGEYYFSKPGWSSGKIKALGPNSGLMGNIFFLDIL